jgi:ubiquitin-protein ligase
MRRLRSDLTKIELLVSQSSILRFRAEGYPPTRYLFEFHGRSLTREKGKVTYRDYHEVEIKLGVSYPRTMPEVRWLTPIYHPNISEIGLVCLGGYGTHWVPSLHLDELCVMLWDMARFHNYDIRSPYNRDAALWASHQTSYAFPIDPRSLRDRREALGRVESPPASTAPVPAIPTLTIGLADLVPDAAASIPPEPDSSTASSSASTPRPSSRSQTTSAPASPPRPPVEIRFLD